MMDFVTMGPKHDAGITYLLEEADVPSARRIGNVSLAVGESDKVYVFVSRGHRDGEQQKQKRC